MNGAVKDKIRLNGTLHNHLIASVMMHAKNSQLVWNHNQQMAECAQIQFAPLGVCCRFCTQQEVRVGGFLFSFNDICG